SEDVYVNGARLRCDEAVTILTGPVVGQVTGSAAVILLEIDTATHRRTGERAATAIVTCFLSLVDENCPRGRVVAARTLTLRPRLPAAFVFGVDDVTRSALLPGRRYSACFGGINAREATERLARFSTLDAAPLRPLRLLAVSGDHPQALPPGQPTLWATVADRLEAGDDAACDEYGYNAVNFTLHLGGHVWLYSAFEEALELV
ncbi:unnamed protein product, partial [Phaeothamnion confervicola]